MRRERPGGRRAPRPPPLASPPRAAAAASPRPSGGLGQAAPLPSGPEPRWPASLAAYLRCLGPARLGKGRLLRPRRVNRRTPGRRTISVLSVQECGSRGGWRAAAAAAAWAVGRQGSPEGAPSPLRSSRSVREPSRTQRGELEEKKKKGRKGKERARERERVRGAAEPTPMAADEVAGGARKATKSKLFEFLVHGVVSGGKVSGGGRASWLGLNGGKVGRGREGAPAPPTPHPSSGSAAAQRARPQPRAGAPRGRPNTSSGGLAGDGCPGAGKTGVCMGSCQGLGGRTWGRSPPKGVGGWVRPLWGQPDGLSSLLSWWGPGATPALGVGGGTWHCCAGLLVHQLGQCLRSKEQVTLAALVSGKL